MNVEPWQDKPEAKPFPVRLGERELELNIGNCAIALFRHRPNMDYLAIQTEVGTDDEAWHMVFDKHEMLYWMGGIALTAYDRENIRRAENKLGSFYSRYGWNPDVVIEDYPNANEVEVYIDYITRDADHPEVLLEQPESEDGEPE